MIKEEALTRIKTGNFNIGYGFDMQLLIDAVGTMGEMLRNGQVNEVVRCKDCKHCVKELNGELYCDILAIGYEPLGSKKVTADWFCANGERR